MLWLIQYAIDAMAQTVGTDTVTVRIHIDSVALGEVVVMQKRTPAANSQFSDLQPVELVTVGGANGDLYKALQTLPGTQVQGESGKLLVRGGNSEETQTFIDGMHVLNPYTSGAHNASARSRYSTFMFCGVNMAAGGAPLEYGNALSAVLPLETKDYSRVNKLGMQASIVGVGGGGTRVLLGGSLSVDFNHQDLTLYDRLFPQRTHYDNPYTMTSAAAQWRQKAGKEGLLKLYVQYDRTELTSREGVEARRFALGEDNFYLNTTWHRRSAAGWNYFAGLAVSWFRQHVEGAQREGDHWRKKEYEVHLKSTAERAFAEGHWRVGMGMEGYLPHYEEAYRLPSVSVERGVSPSLGAMFVSLATFPWEWMKVSCSLRGEYVSVWKQWSLAPRVSLNAYWGPLMWSAVVEHYTQQPSFSSLVQMPEGRTESCWQYNLGMHYKTGGRLAKAELYYKEYDRLAWYDGAKWTSSGYGHGYGVDVFFSDPVSVRRLEYQVAYTYYLGKRKAGTDPVMTVPQYATRHNASLVLKYTLPAWHTILGVTNRVASGRPYHDANKPGWMNAEEKPYHSLDVGITYLPTKRIILHASVTNLLGRVNVYGREEGRPVLAANDRFCYVGVFLTLGKKAAYDISNF